MANQRILRGVAATLTTTFIDQNGIAADAVGAVTVAVTRADGTVLVPAGTATTHGAAGSGVYNVAVTAAQMADLDLLTAVWSDSGVVRQTTYHEVVSAFYVSIAELRSMPNLTDATKVTDAKLVGARDWFETLCESYCDRAFVPRYRRITVWGSGDQTLQLPDVDIRRIRSLGWGTISLSALSLANLAVDASGLVSRWWPYPSNLSEDFEGGWFNRFPPRARITVAYEYGLDSPPSHLKQAALDAIRFHVLENNDHYGRPTLSVADGSGGTTRYAMPGPGRPTGIPDVDVVLNDPNLNMSDRFNVGSIST